MAHDSNVTRSYRETLSLLYLAFVALRYHCERILVLKVTENPSAKGEIKWYSKGDEFFSLFLMVFAWRVMAPKFAGWRVIEPKLSAWRGTGHHNVMCNLLFYKWFCGYRTLIDLEGYRLVMIMAVRQILSRETRKYPNPSNERSERLST